MEKLRSLVRPVLTLTGWLVLLYLAVVDSNVRELFFGTVTMMIGYWFGQRKSG